MFDKNGNILDVGDEVIVPDPIASDLHNFSFIGHVTDILVDRGTAIVEDQDSDFFEIECDRLLLADAD